MKSMSSILILFSLVIFVPVARRGLPACCVHQSEGARPQRGRKANQNFALALFIFPRIPIITLSIFCQAEATFSSESRPRIYSTAAAQSPRRKGDGPSRRTFVCACFPFRCPTIYAQFMLCVFAKGARGKDTTQRLLWLVLFCVCLFAVFLFTLPLPCLRCVLIFGDAILHETKRQGFDRSDVASTSRREFISVFQSIDKSFSATAAAPFVLCLRFTWLCSHHYQHHQCHYRGRR